MTDHEGRYRAAAAGVSRNHHDLLLAAGKLKACTVIDREAHVLRRVKPVPLVYPDTDDLSDPFASPQARARRRHEPEVPRGWWARLRAWWRAGR
jgi:hypothetical protein